MAVGGKLEKLVFIEIVHFFIIFFIFINFFRGLSQLTSRFYFIFMAMIINFMYDINHIYVVFVVCTYDYLLAIKIIKIYYLSILYAFPLFISFIFLSFSMKTKLYLKILYMGILKSLQPHTHKMSK